MGRTVSQDTSVSCCIFVFGQKLWCIKALHFLAKSLVAIMKSTIKILVVIIFAFGCTAANWPVEDKLYSCLIEEYKSQGIDLIPLLDSLENHYIKVGILQDHSGQAKFDFYKKIAASGEVPTMVRYQIADSVAKVKFFQNEINSCIESNGIDSLTLEKSKYYKLMEEYKTMSESSPKNAAICHTRVLTACDFEHPYFRAHMLTTATRILDRPSAFIRNINH